MSSKIHKLKPYPVYKVWGGTKLALNDQNILKKDASNNSLGELWEVSVHHDGPCSLEASGELLKDSNVKGEMPYLIKYIDCSENLSVQVHPGDDYAKRVENSLGKTECWLILDSDPGSGIYLGFKSGVNKSEFKKAVDEGEDLRSYLNFYETKPGDFFYVPAGSVHAIAAGVTLAEVQQSSGITYRVWDWNRVDSEGKGRELHIDKAIDVLEFSEKFNTLDFFKFKNVYEASSGSYKMIDHKDFIFDFHSKPKSSVEEHTFSTNRMRSVFCTKGSIEISTKNEKIGLSEYESAVIDATIESIEISSLKDSSYGVVY